MRHDHVGLSVADLDKQAAFYATALGLSETIERFALPAAGVRSVILQGSDGLKIELVERTDSSPQRFTDPYAGAAVQGYFHWALEVADLDAAYDTVLHAGAAEVSAPSDAVRPGARFAYVHDPEGNLIELIQPAG